MHQMDRAMRLRNKKDHGNAFRAIAVVIAIIASAWLLSTITPIPKQSCTVTTFDGTYGEYSQCSNK